MRASGPPKAGGMNFRRGFHAQVLRFRILLAGAALIALSAPAFAAAKKPPPPPPPDPRIGVLEQQLRDVQQQLAEIKGCAGRQ